MTDLSDLLRPEAVLTGVLAGTKKAALAGIAGVAAQLVGQDARAIGERLAAREKLGSTGFGHGVAIPHARLPELKAVTGVFMRLAQPIAFGAVDDLPVDLLFALLSPVEAGADHLKALARVSRRLRDRPFLAKLRGAGSRDALYALLCEDQARERGMSEAPPDRGAAAHFRALESLYASAPINRLFESRLEIVEPGLARIRFRLDERHFHAAGAVHGTSYFKMLDDAAFYAANSLVSDRFLLTTAFNLLFTKPLRAGEVMAEGRWVSGKRRVFVADARLVDADGEEAARGTGTFMRSQIALAGLPGYRAP